MCSTCATLQASAVVATAMIICLLVVIAFELLVIAQALDKLIAEVRQSWLR